MYHFLRHILRSPFWFLKISGNRTDIIDFLSVIAALPWWVLNFFIIWIILVAPFLYDSNLSQMWRISLGILWVLGGIPIYGLIFGWPHLRKTLNETQICILELNAPKVAEVQEAMDDRNAVKDILIIVCVLCFLYAFSSPFYQIYHWLQYGKWFNLSVVEVLKLADVDWAKYPDSWIGVYKILVYFPSALLALICGALAIASLSLFPEKPKT